MQNDMKEDSSVGAVADTVPAAANPLAVRLGFQAGEVVQELGWDEDCDEELRQAIMDTIGADLVDVDFEDVVDAVVLWHRTDDGDLVDNLVDALTSLADGGPIWLLTPKTGRSGHVEPSEIGEAAPTAGLSATSSISAGPGLVRHPAGEPEGRRQGGEVHGSSQGRRQRGELAAICPPRTGRLTAVLPSIPQQPDALRPGRQQRVGPAGPGSRRAGTGSGPGRPQAAAEQPPPARGRRSGAGLHLDRPARPERLPGRISGASRPCCWSSTPSPSPGSAARNCRRSTRASATSRTSGSRC